MKHTLKILLFLVAVMVYLSSIDGGSPKLSLTAMADTCMVGGVISSNTTWSTAECDTYVVYGNLLVEEGETLTIMPGVVVAFQQTYRLEVGGALTARGEVSDSVVFTGWQSNQQSGWWDYIKFRDSSINTACSLLYCRIEYADNGVYCDSASPTISHCLIRKCAAGIVCATASPYIVQNSLVENDGYPYGFGITAGGGGAPVTFGNIIERNRHAGIYVETGQGAPLTSLSITADTIGQNGTYGVHLYGLGPISCTIRSCEIYENPAGGITSYPDYGYHKDRYLRVTNSYIHDNTADYGGAIYVFGRNWYGPGGFVLIDSNCITGNWATSVGYKRAGGIYFTEIDSARVQYNDIVGNSNPVDEVFEVYSGTPASPDIPGEYNWWGTANSDSISYLIYDYYDNFDLHKFIFAPFADSSHPYCWIRGDANGDGVINSADVVYLINYLFVPGSPAPEPLEAGDVNSDGVINSADVVYLINYLFVPGSPPPDCP